MKKIIYLSSLILLVLFLNSCIKEPEIISQKKSLKSSNLSESIKQYNYKGNVYNLKFELNEEGMVEINEQTPDNMFLLNLIQTKPNLAEHSDINDNSYLFDNADEMNEHISNSEMFSENIINSRSRDIESSKFELKTTTNYAFSYMYKSPTYTNQFSIAGFNYKGKFYSYTPSLWSMPYNNSTFFKSWLPSSSAIYPGGSFYAIEYPYVGPNNDDLLLSIWMGRTIVNGNTINPIGSWNYAAHWIYQHPDFTGKSYNKTAMEVNTPIKVDNLNNVVMTKFMWFGIVYWNNEVTSYAAIVM